MRADHREMGTQRKHMDTAVDLGRTPKAFQNC